MALGSIQGARTESQNPLALRSRIAQLYWRGVFALSEQYVFADCRVGIFLPQTRARPILKQKCTEALECLRNHSPKHFERVRSHAKDILVLGAPGYHGKWLRPPRLIQLNEEWVLNPETRAIDVAATIVHEATHAWLEHHGYAFVAARRQRIEAICYRAEAAFARRVPNAEDLVALYEACAEFVLEQPENDWSDAALRDRQAEELRDLGAPEWLVNAVVRITTMLPNVR